MCFFRHNFSLAQNSLNGLYVVASEPQRTPSKSSSTLVILFLLYDSTLFLPLSEGCGFLKVILVCFLFSFFFPLFFHGELNPGLLHDRHELYHPTVPQSVAWISQCFIGLQNHLCIPRWVPHPSFVATACDQGLKDLSWLWYKCCSYITPLACWNQISTMQNQAIHWTEVCICEVASWPKTEPTSHRWCWLK